MNIIPGNIPTIKVTKAEAEELRFAIKMALEQGEYEAGFPRVLIRIEEEE
mgnify:CR=1 FL=1